MPKLSVNFLFYFLSYLFIYLFFALWSSHYGFTDYFEILNFVFCNVIPTGILTCKILTF